MYQCRVLPGSVYQMTLAKYLLVHQQKFGGGGLANPCLWRLLSLAGIICTALIPVIQSS